MSNYFVGNNFGNYETSLFFAMKDERELVKLYYVTLISTSQIS